MTAQEKLDLIQTLEQKGRLRRKMLKKLDIAESTYYHWRKKYQEEGPDGLEPTVRVPKSVNRLTESEGQEVVNTARAFPELSARLLALKMTDEGSFSVSESTVFRILKRHGMVRPRPREERPAASTWSHKTSRPNEIWQIDGSQFWVPHWGFYKWIPVEDDFSRKVITWKLQPDETAGSISQVVEEAVEKVGVSKWPEERRPVLLSDNGPGFISNHLAKYLEQHKIRQIHGKPYHPQTQGKVERLNRRIKEEVNLLVYESPAELEKAIKETVERYNMTPHESLKNVSPIDVYEGRQEEILASRAAKKQWTLEQRRRANLALAINSN
jgi:transposase InsO family protein